MQVRMTLLAVGKSMEPSGRVGLSSDPQHIADRLKTAFIAGAKVMAPTIF
jgi:hypothetical protein